MTCTNSRVKDIVFYIRERYQKEEAMNRFKIIVTDDRFGSYREENEVLKEIGSTVEVHNLQTAEEAVQVVTEADAEGVNALGHPTRIEHVHVAQP